LHRSRLVVPLAILASALLATPAGAAIVTVGSPMTGSYASGTIGLSYAVFNTEVPGHNVSPVNGAVIGWNMQGGSGGPFTLRVIHQRNSTEYLGGGRSTPVTPTSTAFQHFSAAVPIKVGDMVAFDHANPSDHIGFGTPILGGNKLDFFSSPLEEGAVGTAMVGSTVEAAFNAEVQPEPVVTAIGTTAGPLSGGTAVLIAGTDLENTTQITFGGTPATFGQDTEGSVLATSPPSASAGSAPITVTTLAGSSTAAQGFVYQGAAASTSPVATTGSPTPGPVEKCKVPNLAGKTVGATRRALKASHCTLGKIKKRSGPKAKVGKVVKQASKPGTSLPDGAAVGITVGQASSS
jgi:IPT/TIG domain-containing protein/PASTA domain-containing protein